MTYRVQITMDQATIQTGKGSSLATDIVEQYYRNSTEGAEYKEFRQRANGIFEARRDIEALFEDFDQALTFVSNVGLFTEEIVAVDQGDGIELLEKDFADGLEVLAEYPPLVYSILITPIYINVDEEPSDNEEPEDYTHTSID